MRAVLLAALVAFCAPAWAQDTTTTPPKAGDARARASAPAVPKGKARAEPTAAQKEQALNAEAKKAREESERRMKERDRKLERAIGTICRGC